jgi:hypothetical protein
VTSLASSSSKPAKTFREATGLAKRKEKNQRTDSPVRQPTARVTAVREPAIDRGYLEQAGDLTPVRVNRSAKRPHIVSPQIVVTDPKGKPKIDTSKRARLLDDPRKGGTTTVENAIITITPARPKPGEDSTEDVLAPHDYEPGEEVNEFTAEGSTGIYCTCENATDPASLYPFLVECVRGDLCSGSRWYHPECLRNPNDLTPNPQENEVTLKAYYEEIAYVCAACQEDQPLDAHEVGHITSGDYPNVGNELTLTTFSYVHKRWFQEGYKALTNATIMRNQPYRASEPEIRGTLLPSVWKTYMDNPLQNYTRVHGLFNRAAYAKSPAFLHMQKWEDEIAREQAVYVIVGDFPSRTKQCVKEFPKEHGIGKTDKDEDPLALLQLASLPAIPTANYLILAGNDLQHLEIMVASFGPTLGTANFGIAAREAELMDSLCLSWLSTGDLTTLRPRGWKNQKGEERSKGSPRFRLLRGHPSAGSRAVIHGGVWSPFTIQKERNFKSFPHPTAESSGPPGYRGWQEYLAATDDLNIHKRLGICHEWVDPVGHLRRRRTIDNLPSYLQRNIPNGSPGCMEVINFNVSTDCHVNPNDHGYTIQYVHGRFSGGDLAFRNLQLRAPCPSTTITMIRTQTTEHALLDWVPRDGNGESWDNTYRFSHPVTMPRRVVGSIIVNKDRADIIRGGSWAFTRTHVMARRMADMDFNPNSEVELLNTSSRMAPYTYIGHATLRNDENPDHLRDAHRRMLRDYETPQDVVGPEGRKRQQDHALDVVPTTATLTALITKYPAQIPVAGLPPTLPDIPRDIDPTPLELIRYQHVIPLPTKSTPAAIRKWWYEVRVRNAEAARELQARTGGPHYNQEPAVHHPTRTAIEIDLTYGEEEPPAGETTTIEATAAVQKAKGALTAEPVHLTSLWVFKYNGEELELMTRTRALELFTQHSGMPSPTACEGLLEDLLVAESLQQYRLPTDWTPGMTVPTSHPTEMSEYIDSIWTMENHPQAYRGGWKITRDVSELPATLTPLARRTGYRSILDWTMWDETVLTTRRSISEASASTSGSAGREFGRRLTRAFRGER